MRVESAAGLALCRPVAGGLGGMGGSVHQVECLVEWQGSCEQESLSERAAQLAERVELCSGFDAFGDHADAERWPSSMAARTIATPVLWASEPIRARSSLSRSSGNRWRLAE